MTRHIPVARLTAIAAVVVGAIVVMRGAGNPHWRTIKPGIEFTTFRGEPWCKRGSAEIAVLRIDPARARLRVHHYSRVKGSLPPDIVEWQRRTGAVAVFNAGQYYADYSYMGLLVSDGDTVSRKPHPKFMAALVASDEPGAFAAHVVDLQLDSAQAGSRRWSEVAQSFMLFDRTGEIRVRKGDHVANRTAVAEDRAGRLLVVTTEGGYTLSDFARLLQASPFELSHAMAMDGGYEAKLLVSAGRFQYASFGRWERGQSPPDQPGALVPLPAVVSVGETP